MRRVLLSTLAILAITASTSTAALAEDTTPSAEAKPAKSAPAKATASLGARIASTIVGGIAGIPVSMVKKTRQEVVIATKDLVGDTDNKWKLAVGAVPLGISAGIVSGFFQGFFYGPYNAWKHSANAPFSASTFSLGDEK